MILILSNKWDVTVDFVVRELQEREHPYLRLNTEDISELDISTELPDLSVTVENHGRSVDLVKEVGAVWYRRPGKPFEFTDDEKPSQGTVEYIREQWGAWIESLQAVPNISWMNDPLLNHKMESKIRQLNLADEIGFKIPQTKVTNRRPDIDEMFERHGSVISKALSSPLVTENEEDEFVYTVCLDEPPADNQSVQVSPTIFQEPMLPKTDYRVTVIGDTVFPVKIRADDDEGVPVDWRTKKEDVEFVQQELPERIEDLCRRYVNEAGLVFGAIDLVETDGNFVFLEINPNGEWGWLQKPWGVPIAESLTEKLIQLDREADRN
ncbi:MvdC/MvdD family ATP grasp protein [Haloarchaeobius amylolyticus]|uniref:MvdC/MvdD family ATP grasp protein n=1 Tax=Haloarchaeobius amylolyticus TaxID=1198296 RepID=A0ABD6BC31_9EURY